MSDGRGEDHLILERDGSVALLRINRPAVRNALNQALMADIVARIDHLDRDPDIRAIVLTGDDRAFAAGADIAEMATLSAVDLLLMPQSERWERLRRIRLPLIAAVRGFALGGGCELAMVCDMIVAGESARFALPEINLGIMPGGGGTQRLIRAVGKAKAMELILTGRPITAAEALAAGLVTRMVPDELCVDEAMRLAREIAAKPAVAVRLAKEAVLRALDLPLEAGMAFERRSFETLFATDDRREGMAAFLERRAPEFSGR